MAFLLGVTIAVLLIRSGLGGGNPATTTRGPLTHPSTASVPTSTGRGPTTPSNAQYYTVESGDTFGSISAKTGASIAELEKLNPGVSTNSLQVGQRIRVH